MLFFWALEAYGSTIQPRLDQQDMFEENFTSFFIDESWWSSRQIPEESEFSIVFHPFDDHDLPQASLLAKYLEVFGRSESEQPFEWFFFKRGPESRSMTEQEKEIFVESGRIEAIIEEVGTQWVIFFAGLALLISVLLFRSIPKTLGMVLIVVWLLFWQIITKSVLFLIDFLDTLIRQI
ncbi:MAG: hypothetical protein C4576_35310 [Desulfobacteraceae bacterium]|nr:MAG: hypothetical protein C4576_35310 [Desulfobacteraceae bacterium]